MYFVLYVLLRAIDIYSMILVVYAFMSWFPSVYDSAIGRMVLALVEPVLRPLRRLGLQFMGLDWTVFAAIILLRLLTNLIVLIF